jgi:hypothetical protein
LLGERSRGRMNDSLSIMRSACDLRRVKRHALTVRQRYRWHNRTPLLREPLNAPPSRDGERLTRLI